MEYFEDVERMMKESVYWDGKFIKVLVVGGSVGIDFGLGATSVDESLMMMIVLVLFVVMLNEELFGMEFKVGKVLSVENYFESEKLYVEMVECGEDESRFICFGLVLYMSKDDVLGKFVIVVVNLKLCNMVGMKLNGMFLVVFDVAYENVELFCVSEGVVLGERIIWDGVENIELYGVNKVVKKKIWEGV